MTSSDGDNAELPVATTSAGGVMSKAIFDAVTANTAKATNVTTNLTGTTHASQLTINSSDGTNVVIAEASGSIAGLMTVAHHDKLDAITASAVSAAEAIVAVEGESSLLLAGQVNLRADVGVVTSDPTPAIADSGTIYQVSIGTAGTFTLPASPTLGVQYVLVNGDGEDIVITRPNSNYSINGSTSSTVTNATQWAATSIVCVVAGSSGKWLAFGGI